MILVIANMGIERIAPAPSAQHPLRSEVVPFDVTGPPPLAATDATHSFYDCGRGSSIK
jgi:hypothetical protein